MSDPAVDSDPLQGLMERQLSLLVRLIDDLLDVARITRGKLVLRPGPTTLQQVLDSAVETARPQLSQGRHDLHIELPDAPVAMRADAVRLSQVFANLLTNAAKYSEPRNPTDLAARATENRSTALCRTRTH